MSGSSESLWSDNLNAPRISHSVYFVEKANLAGVILSAIFYGIVIHLFFQCMGALLNPAGRTSGRVKWVLVAHATAMFSFVTIYTATNLDVQSVSYVDNREYPGGGVLPPGPLGYETLMDPEAVSIIRSITFFLNSWLADGLLLYRCYVIYARNYRVIALPCLLYLASLAMGIMVIYWYSQPGSSYAVISSFGLPFYAISVSLNVLLTLMIVTRLILHRRNIRGAMGTQASGLYEVVITMLVESCALYAVAFILFIGPWGISNDVDYIVFPLLAEIQVIAPFLIILRVANRNAVTSAAAVSRSVGSIHFRSGEKPTDDVSLPGRDLVGSMDTSGDAFNELCVGTETTADVLHHD